jgi:hypothetical protein
VIVVTSALLRRGAPDLADAVQTWPRTASVLDEDGRHLTDVDVRWPPRVDDVELDAVDDPAALIHQYFVRGAPTVLLVLDDRSVIGRLTTRWEDGRRSWWLAMDEWPHAL